MKPYYQDKSCIIYHGDCRDILAELESIDLLLTDPPYGLGDKWTGGTWGAQQMYKDAKKWDQNPPSETLLKMAIEKAKNSIIWGGNYFSGLPSCRGLLAWFKIPTLETMADFELAWTTFDRPAKTIQTNRNREHRLHPTQKPMNVIKWCILQADKDRKAETILDPFMGSGTTLRAAKDLGRKAIGIEIDERYCEIAANRLRQEVLDF